MLLTLLRNAPLGSPIRLFSPATFPEISLRGRRCVVGDDRRIHLEGSLTTKIPPPRAAWLPVIVQLRIVALSPMENSACRCWCWCIR